MLLKPARNAALALAALARHHPRVRGCTGWLLFPEGGGTSAYDFSTIARRYDVTGNATWGQGPHGAVLTCDGSDDAINTNVPISTFITAPAATVFVRVRCLGAAPAQNAAVYNGTGIVTDQNAYFGIYRAVVTTGQDRLWVYNWDNTEDRVEITQTVGEWVDIVWQHSGGLLAAYKNGGLVGSIASGNTQELTNPLVVGRGVLYFTGELSEVRLYPYALTPPAIASLTTTPFMEMDWALAQLRRQTRAIVSASAHLVQTLFRWRNDDGSLAAP